MHVTEHSIICFHGPPSLQCQTNRHLHRTRPALKGLSGQKKSVHSVGRAGRGRAGQGRVGQGMWLITWSLKRKTKATNRVRQAAFSGPCVPANSAWASDPISGAPLEVDFQPKFSGVYGTKPKKFRPPCGLHCGSKMYPKKINRGGKAYANFVVRQYSFASLEEECDGSTQ